MWQIDAQAGQSRAEHIVVNLDKKRSQLVGEENPRNGDLEVPSRSSPRRVRRVAAQIHAADLKQTDPR
jgi:hypothetical protein